MDIVDRGIDVVSLRYWRMEQPLGLPYQHAVHMLDKPFQTPVFREYDQT